MRRILFIIAFGFIIFQNISNASDNLSSCKKFGWEPEGLKKMTDSTEMKLEAPENREISARKHYMDLYREAQKSLEFLISNLDKFDQPEKINKSVEFFTWKTILNHSMARDSFGAIECIYNETLKEARLIELKLSD